MNKVERAISTVRELFQTRPSGASIAWEKERVRAATDAAGNIPVHDIEAMMNIKTAREVFINRFNRENNLRKRLQGQERSRGIEDPTRNLQTEFDTDF